MHGFGCVGLDWRVPDFTDEVAPVWAPAPPFVWDGFGARRSHRRPVRNVSNAAKRPWTVTTPVLFRLLAWDEAIAEYFGRERVELLLGTPVLTPTPLVVGTTVAQELEALGGCSAVCVGGTRKVEPAERNVARTDQLVQVISGATPEQKSDPKPGCGFQDLGLEGRHACVQIATAAVATPGRAQPGAGRAASSFATPSIAARQLELAEPSLSRIKAWREFLQTPTLLPLCCPSAVRRRADLNGQDWAGAD